MELFFNWKAKGGKKLLQLDSYTLSQKSQKHLVEVVIIGIDICSRVDNNDENICSSVDNNAFGVFNIFL